MQAWTEAITYIATVMIEGGNAEEADVQRQQAANEAKFEELKAQARASKGENGGGGGGGNGGQGGDMVM